MTNKIDYYKKKANEVHGGKYDYSLWTSYGGTTKDYHTRNIPVVCPEHGQFFTSLSNHLRGAGCPECGKQSSIQKRRKKVEYFIKKARDIHGDLYDYSKWTPVDNTSVNQVEIICKLHGSFFQTPASHIDKKAGCPKCGVDKRTAACLAKYGVAHHSQKHIPPSTREKLENYAWMYQQHVIHKKTLVEIASDLQVQDTTVGRYMNQHNISVVRFPVSYNEKQLNEWLGNYSVTIISNSRNVIPPHELDIFIPEYNIAIEYCGIFWHSEQNGKTKRYHENKFLKCQEKNIQLITIFEDEWINRKDIVKQKILYLINKDPREKIYARSTVVQQVSASDKKDFFDKYHIQGNGPSSINLGLLTNKNELVAVMGFIKRSKDIYELTRYATSRNVVGGFSKLVKHFQRKFSWRKIISFADRRWSDGKLYSKNGWEQEKILDPDYFYSTNGHDRLHKFNFRRSALSKKLEFFDPTLSERQNCDNNGLLRIWDCGKIRYSIINKNYITH